MSDSDTDSCADSGVVLNGGGDSLLFDSSEDEDDDEHEQLARLRCRSVQTEVLAERQRLRNRRNNQYPGLAFGSSIFSSNTMMKFSVIANELHNIMNVQLKRVSWFHVFC